MTESEWLTCEDPDLMLPLFQGQDRKLRLFACACVRAVWHLLTDDRSKTAVEVAERFADGLVDEKTLNAAWNVARAAANAAVANTAANTAVYAAANAARAAANDASVYAVHAAANASANADGAVYATAYDAARKQQTDLIREIFQYPSKSIYIPQHIQTIAQAIYLDKSFSDLPILADALEDAGCQEIPLLNHLRSGDNHVMGCWALDLCKGNQ